MIKAVFFDIDGTLVNNQAKALASTKYAIDQLQKKAYYAVLPLGATL